MSGGSAEAGAGAATRPMPEVEGVEVRHSWVEADFLRMHVAEAGPPDGEPVVLLHGWPQHWYMWRHQIGPLAERYRVICPDLRGFGWSEAPMWGYEKGRLAEDVLALLDALGQERVHLVGHDWGGVAGFRICLEHPERVERYVALNCGLPWTKLDLATARTVWRLWYQVAIAAPLLGEAVVGRARSVTAAFEDFGGVGQGAWTREDEAIFLDQLREPARARASVLLYRTFLTKEALPFLRGGPSARLAVPTLYLHGADDQVVRPAALRGHEGRADDLAIELLEGIGHFSPEAAADLVTRRIVAFFADEGGAQDTAARTREAPV